MARVARERSTTTAPYRLQTAERDHIAVHFLGQPDAGDTFRRVYEMLHAQGVEVEVLGLWVEPPDANSDELAEGLSSFEVRLARDRTGGNADPYRVAGLLAEALEDVAELAQLRMDYFAGADVRPAPAGRGRAREGEVEPARAVGLL